MFKDEIIQDFKKIDEDWADEFFVEETGDSATTFWTNMGEFKKHIITNFFIKKEDSTFKYSEMVGWYYKHEIDEPDNELVIAKVAAGLT